jgi:glycosyltransferase 2 family protein
VERRYVSQQTRHAVKPTGPRHPSLLRWVRVFLGLAGALFLVVSLVRGWSSGVGDIDIALWRFIAAAGLLVGAGVVLAQSWAAVLNDPTRSLRLARGYMRAQPAKYIPGGWAQPLSQVVHAADGGVHVGRASAAYAVQASCLLVSGAVVGLGLSVVGTVPAAFRWGSLLGVLAVPLLSRRWMIKAVHLVGRLLRKADWDAFVPEQGAIIRCFAWALGAIGLMSLAFASLAAGAYSDPAAFSVGALGFAMAWMIGFAAIPFPAGVAVREAILVAIFAPLGPASVVIGLSVLHRILQMLAELALFVLSGVGPRK